MTNQLSARRISIRDNEFSALNPVHQRFFISDIQNETTFIDRNNDIIRHSPYLAPALHIPTAWYTNRVDDGNNKHNHISSLSFYIRHKVRNIPSSSW